ncbi:MAG: hypothetical protein M0Q91_12135 [Methanoregula sp.]|jgi:hypothetical protein|nr:hypothetical protein [Methanoregula sp.]
MTNEEMLQKIDDKVWKYYLKFANIPDYIAVNTNDLIGYTEKDGIEIKHFDDVEPGEVKYGLS